MMSVSVVRLQPEQAEKIAECFVDGCEGVIYRKLLTKIPGSSEHLQRRHGMVCPKHECIWSSGFVRYDDNPVRWLNCNCTNCRGFRRQFSKCCKQCGKIPPERMYVGLLYRRGMISKDLKTLLVRASDDAGYDVCGRCGRTALTSSTPPSEEEEEAAAEQEEGRCCLL